MNKEELKEYTKSKVRDSLKKSVTDNKKLDESLKGTLSNAYLKVTAAIGGVVGAGYTAGGIGMSVLGVLTASGAATGLIVLTGGVAMLAASVMTWKLGDIAKKYFNSRKLQKMVQDLDDTIKKRDKIITDMLSGDTEDAMILKNVTKTMMRQGKALLNYIETSKKSLQDVGVSFPERELERIEKLAIIAAEGKATYKEDAADKKVKL